MTELTFLGKEVTANSKSPLSCSLHSRPVRRAGLLARHHQFSRKRPQAIVEFRYLGGEVRKHANAGVGGSLRARYKTGSDLVSTSMRTSFSIRCSPSAAGEWIAVCRAWAGCSAPICAVNREFAQEERRGMTCRGDENAR